MTLELLFAIDPAVRLGRITAQTAPLDRPLVFALREVVLFDEDAGVRASAAAALGRGDVETASAPLVDALYDSHPSVRAAACRALGRVGCRPAPDVLRRLALEEPIWWVRRAAVLSVARLDRADAIALLGRVLDDPFWRVRHAAARALVVLGSHADALAQVLAESDASERAAGAAQWIERRLGHTGAVVRPTSELARTSALASGPLADPDPAVITARVERGDPATSGELALYLGDPHEALRRAVTERLLATGNARAILLGALWLEEPRIPHATATVVKLLDRLHGALLDEVLTQALAEVDTRPGLAVWALSFIATVGLWERSSEILAASEAESPLVRRQAIAMLAGLEASDRLRTALGDPDADVRRLAVKGLLDLGDRATVLALPFDEQPVLVQRMLVMAAKDDPKTLAAAARSRDPETRARALSSWSGLGDRTALRASEDPWIRSAVMGADNALDVLANDPDPIVRRQAFGRARRGGDVLAAARTAARDADEALRVVAAERLARSSEDEDLVRVLHLSRDPSLAVRAAAADVLVVDHAIDVRLARVRETDESIRRAADTWLGKPLAFDESAPRIEFVPGPPPSVASPRPLGNTGIVLSPLVVSGAYEPSVTSLFGAHAAGCNAFFWEPRHRHLTTFFKTTRHAPVVVAGTYHASAKAIRADVVRALRRLRRDHLDVFLVFWTRSALRLEGEVARVLEDLRREGKVRAVGFSTHDRALARQTIGRAPWQVVMLRHSAVHPGAEERGEGPSLFESAADHGVGVLSFSATSYGRLFRPMPGTTSSPSAAECYRYSLSQRGVTACVSAPRGGRQLAQNLDVLRSPTLDDRRLAELRAHGALVREESLDFARFIRRFPALPEAALDDLLAEPDDLEEHARE